MPMDFGGQRSYVYCGSGGVAGVSAKDGSLLWETNAWKISIATVPSPLVLAGGKIFLSGGYGAGSMLIQLNDEGGKLVPKILWRVGPEVFGATQHTPLFHNGSIFGTRPNGQFVCLGLDGKVAWASPPVDSFGRSPFLLADGLFYVMSEEGNLGLMEDSTSRYKLLSQAQVLKGGEAWGPMAMAGGRLLVRDLTHLVCLDVAASSQAKSDPAR
jgi:outer membrane protein assembly factor BamB